MLNTGHLKEYNIIIRNYKSEDAVACHSLRRNAFLNTFDNELPNSVVLTGANSYGVDEFSDLIGSMSTVVAMVDEAVVGFCSIRLLKPTRAELLYLYIDEQTRGSGVGSLLVSHSESLATNSHEDLTEIFLDTAVPEYNQAFWERMGYELSGPSTCQYPNAEILAVRLLKRVR